MSASLFTKKESVFAAFEGLIAGVQPVLQAANVPIASSVLASVSQIIKLAGAVKTNKEACGSIADRCLNLLLVIKDSMEGVDRSIANEKFLSDADGLRKTLKSVEDMMLLIQKRGKFSRFLHSSIIASKIRQCDVDLNKAIEVFSVKMIVGQDKKLDKILQNTTRDITLVPKDLDDYMLDREPPARPGIFHGRDAYVKETVNGIISGQLTRIPILGLGGIGKTSLASAIIDHEDIRTTFSEHRYFIRCSALSGAQELISALSQIIIGSDSLKENPKNPLGLLLQFLKGVPGVLIVLDNLETIWHVDNQQDIKKVLNSFFKLDTLALMITMRGSHPPEGFVWSDNKSTRVLPALSLQDAKQTFRALCTDFEDSEENRVDLSHLLNQLDGVPLAIRIVAHIASVVPPKEISSKIAQYLKTYRDDPDNSIKASVSLSLNSFVVKRNPSSIDVLKVIAYLPGGITSDSIDEIMQLPKSTPSMRLIAALMAAGLVHKEGRRYNTLSPIRLYMEEAYPIDEKTRQSVVEYYFRICENSSSACDSAETLTLLSVEKLNCTKVLSDALKAQPERGRDNKTLLKAIIGFSCYLYHTFPSLELLQNAQSRFEACDDTSIKADYNQIWGLIASMKSNWEEARLKLWEAREQFTSVGNRQKAADCLLALGEIARAESNHNEARAILSDAKEQFRNIGDRRGVVQCIQRLGDVARMECNYGKARVMLSDAREQLSGIGDRRGAANCLLSLGIIAYREKNYVDARVMMSEAKEYFSSFGNRQRGAYCLRFLGDIARMESNHDEARVLLWDAREQFSDIGDKLGVARCSEGLGSTAMRCGNYEDAKQLFLQAIDIFEDIGIAADLERCRRQLDELFNSTEKEKAI